MSSLNETGVSKASPTESHRDADRLPCLDGLRAIAVLMVVLSHGWKQTGITLPGWFEPIMRAWGSLGVELFFGLSGFLITHLLCREFERYGSIDIKAFYLRRAVRILPPLLLFLGTISVLNIAGVFEVPWRDICAGLFFFRNYVTSDVTTDAWYLCHLWSLSMEEQFYLFLPFVLARLGPRKMWRYALVLALVMPLMRVGSYFLMPGQRSSIGSMFHCSADRLLWGSILALGLHLRRVFPGDRAGLFRSRGVFVAVAVLFFLILPHVEKIGGAPYSFIAGITVRSLCVLFVLKWLGSNPGSTFASILDTRALQMTGLMSYSIYLWQQVFVGERPELFNGMFPLAVAACLFAGAVSYLVGERPFLALRKKLRSHRTLGKGVKRTSTKSVVVA